MWSLSDVFTCQELEFFSWEFCVKIRMTELIYFFTVVRVKSVLMFGLQFLRWPAFRTVWLFQTYSAVGRTVENADNVQESTSRVLLWAIAFEAGISHIWISPIGHHVSPASHHDHPLVRGCPRNFAPPWRRLDGGGRERGHILASCGHERDTDRRWYPE